MSAFKKAVGLVAGVGAVTAIGVAVAQGVPPNPAITNPALGAGEQTVHITPIGETGVLAWEGGVAQNVAVLTKENEQAAVASQTQPEQPVAQAPAPAADTNVAQANTLPPPSNEMGAGPSQPLKPKHDRG
jgi:hypothetical protein